MIEPIIIETSNGRYIHRPKTEDLQRLMLDLIAGLDPEQLYHLARFPGAGFRKEVESS